MGTITVTKEPVNVAAVTTISGVTFVQTCVIQRPVKLLLV